MPLPSLALSDSKIGLPFFVNSLTKKDKLIFVPYAVSPSRAPEPSPSPSSRPHMQTLGAPIACLSKLSLTLSPSLPLALPPSHPLFPPSVTQRRRRHPLPPPTSLHCLSSLSPSRLPLTIIPLALPPLACSRLPLACSHLPLACSRLPLACSRLPLACSRLPLVLSPPLASLLPSRALSLSRYLSLPSCHPLAHSRLHLTLPPSLALALSYC